ncbi:MAG: hypothetical protein ACREO4_09465 [Lysobacter sp.]
MAKHKFIAKVNVKGDFDADDGLGTAMQEVPAGQKASTDDKKLYDSMIEQGYIKAAKKGEGEDEEVAVSDPATKAPAVKSTDKTNK